MRDRQTCRLILDANLDCVFYQFLQALFRTTTTYRPTFAHPGDDDDDNGLLNDGQL